MAAQLGASRAVLSSTHRERERCYIFTVDDVRTSEETHLRDSTSGYGASLNFFYMGMMFVLHRKHTYGPPLPATGIALLFYMSVITISPDD
jgi:hypothetical protein